MEVGAEVVEATEEDEEEEKKEKKEKEEGEGGQQNWSCGKKFPLLPCLVQVLLLLFWGLQRGYPLWTCFLAFLNKGFIRKSAVW